MSVWAKLAKISSRKNFYLYSIPLPVGIISTSHTLFLIDMHLAYYDCD